MEPFKILGVNENASEKEISEAFRKRASELAASPDETQLRELIDAREQALSSTPSNLPKVQTTKSLAVADYPNRDIIPHQDFAAQFDRSTKALFSKRITPLTRLKSLATVLTLLSAVSAALSFDKFNPLLETVLQTELETRQRVADDAIGRTIEQLESELSIANLEYDKLQSMLDGKSNLRKFATLLRLAVTKDRLHLIYGAAEVKLMRGVPAPKTVSLVSLKRLVRDACISTGSRKVFGDDSYVWAANHRCGDHHGSWVAERPEWPLDLSVILTGVRPGIEGRSGGVPGLVLSKQHPTERLPGLLRQTERGFDRLFRGIASTTTLGVMVPAFFEANLGLAKLSWLYEFKNALDGPTEKAIQDRKRITTLVSVGSLGLSIFFATSIPLLWLVINRRNRQIEWLMENLEDQAVVYGVLGDIFGLGIHARGWLARDGPGMVEEWLKGANSQNGDVSSELRTIRRVVGSNLDPVRFHRMLTSRGLSIGFLKQQYVRFEGDVAVRYIIVVPETE